MVDATGHRTPETPLGFFPGYPGLVAAARLLTGGNLVAAGLLVSTAAGVAAAFGLTRLGESVPGGSRRAGLLLTCLFAASPMAVALSMAYTEALFCALAVWALVGVLREQWMLAGRCAAGAGLVRPTGSSVVAAVGLAALAAVIQRRGGWRPWVAGVLAATGALGYVGYVAVRTGVLGGWFVTQREGWGWHRDGGAATVRWLAEVLTSSGNVFDLSVGRVEQRGLQMRRAGADIGPFRQQTQCALRVSGEDPGVHTTSEQCPDHMRPDDRGRTDYQD